MANGYVSYSKPQTGSLASYIGGKVKDAAGMAAGERKARQEEINELENKKEKTAEEAERLSFLKSQDKERKGSITKSFFAKAMMTQFGGDKLRRTKGFFSKNPAASEDPSLTKDQRFSALLDKSARPADAPVAPDDYDDSMNSGAPEGAVPPQQPLLEKILGKIKDSYAAIGAKVMSLKATETKSLESKDKNTTKLSQVISLLEGLKQYFKKDNDLKVIENTIEREKLEHDKEVQNDAEMAAEQASIAQGADLSSNVDVDTGDGKAGKGGFVNTLMDWGGKLLNMFGPKKGPKINSRSSGYTNPIGPQRKFEGAAPKGNTWKPNSGGGFDPIMPSEPKLSEGGVVPGVKKPDVKLNRGGIYDNPTRVGLNPGDSVIPLNRNNALAKTFKSAGSTGGGLSKMVDPMTKVMQLPTKVGGGLLMGLLSKLASQMGGLAGMIKPFISGLAKPIASMFGLPATIVSSMFGAGPAEAATFDIENFFKGGGTESTSSSSSGSADSNPPSGTPGSLMADLEADVGKGAADMSSEIMSSGAGGLVNPTEQPWCAAYVNSQLKRNGIQGSGSAAADSFSNWGSEVSKNNIQPGDVIVGDYGAGSRTHVMFAAGTPQGGYVDIIGGNQSNKVTRGSIALNKIDYVRRAGANQATSPTGVNNPVRPDSTNLSPEDQALFEKGGGLTAMTRDNKTIQQVIAQGRLNTGDMGGGVQMPSIFMMPQPQGKNDQELTAPGLSGLNLYDPTGIDASYFSRF